jgi:hypothetical protein
MCPRAPRQATSPPLLGPAKQLDSGAVTGTRLAPVLRNRPQRFAGSSAALGQSIAILHIGGLLVIFN